jgi:hypothetical protein
VLEIQTGVWVLKTTFERKIEMKTFWKYAKWVVIALFFIRLQVWAMQGGFVWFIGLKPAEVSPITLSMKWGMSSLFLAASAILCGLGVEVVGILIVRLAVWICRLAGKKVIEPASSEPVG